MQQRTVQTYGANGAQDFPPMSDVEVLEEMAKHGPHAPNLWGVSGAQWQRIITMLNMMEACIRIGADPRMLYFQPEFFGAHRRYGGNSRVA